MTAIERWLTGPVDGITPLLQPAAHSFLQIWDELESCSELSSSELWVRPNGVAAIGWHLYHISGSTDRLLTYARGEQLDQAQLRRLKLESEIHFSTPDISELLFELKDTVAGALNQIRSTPEATLLEPRWVGRARLSSTVIGLLFHAAEHAFRHAGQVVILKRLSANDSIKYPEHDDGGKQ